jgi:uracil-DNA glycosylase family 4
MRSNKDLLAQIERVLATCHKCRLWRTATKVVPGEGNPKAAVMFIGEAPGFNEDQMGRPFVGRAGQLLEKLLAKIGLSRKDVYITNVVKHRPPKNRAPNKDEIRTCLPYLYRQIQIINPKVIVPLGRFALEVFISDQTISKIHGQLFKAKGRLIYPVYHPAAALRSGAVLRELEKDFTKLPKVIKGEVKPQLLQSENGDENQLALFS